jgi:hypothetical protein
MTSQQEFFAETKISVENYVQNRIHLIKLQAAEKTSKVASGMFSGLLIAVISFFIILFLSIMAAWYFAAVTGSVYIGFGIISAFYIILLVLIFVLKKSVLDKMVSNSIINIFFEKTPEDHDNDTSAQ